MDIENVSIIYFLLIFARTNDSLFKIALKYVYYILLNTIYIIIIKQTNETKNFALDRRRRVTIQNKEMQEKRFLYQNIN